MLLLLSEFLTGLRWKSRFGSRQARIETH
jgi:hypothetical protein